MTKSQLDDGELPRDGIPVTAPFELTPEHIGQRLMFVDEDAGPENVALVVHLAKAFMTVHGAKFAFDDRGTWMMIDGRLYAVGMCMGGDDAYYMIVGRNGLEMDVHTWQDVEGFFE